MPSKRQKKEMDARRLTIYWDDELRNELADLSEEMGIPQSQILAFYFITGNAGLNNARQMLPRYLVPSGAARWKWNIDLDRLKEDFGL
jgi:hypothetical protein